MRGPRVEVESQMAFAWKKKEEGRNWRTREDRYRALSSVAKWQNQAGMPGSNASETRNPALVDTW